MALDHIEFIRKGWYRWLFKVVRKISGMGFLLEGKALKAFISLLMKSWGNYEQLKDTLLNCCNADAETCRKKERKQSGWEWNIRSASSKNDSEPEKFASAVKSWKWFRPIVRIPRQGSIAVRVFLLKVFVKEKTFESALNFVQAADRYCSAHRNACSSTRKIHPANEGTDGC